MLRRDAERAQIWENATTLFAGIKPFFGANPKEEYNRSLANEGRLQMFNPDTQQN